MVNTVKTNDTVRGQGRDRAALAAAVLLASGFPASLGAAQDPGKPPPGVVEPGRPISPPSMVPAKPGANPQPGARPAQPAQPTRTPTFRPGQPAAAAGVAGQPPAPIDPSSNPPTQSEWGPQADGTYIMSAFGEPVELTMLIGFVREQLSLPLMYTDSGLQGQTVVIDVPISLRTDQVVPFLNLLLEQRGYTIVQDRSGVYLVQPVTSVVANPGSGPLFSTQIIPVVGVRPTSLQPALATLLTAGGQGLVGGQPTYLDDVGVIVITANPRQTGMVREFVREVERLVSDMRWERYELSNVSATAARDRVLELLGSGGAMRTPGTPAQPGQPPGMAASIAGGLTSLPDRLQIDTSTNALLLRGRSEENAQLRTLLPLIDVPNALTAKWYPVGSSTAEAVVSEGQRQLLGEVSVFTSSGGTSLAGRNPMGRPGIPGQQQPGAPGAGLAYGSGFVLYPDSGGFIFRGTPQQHERVALLITALADLSEKDVVTYEFYKLRHSKSQDVVTIVESLISNQAPVGRSPLLGEGLGSRTRSARDRNANRRDQTAEQARAEALAAADGAADSSLGEIQGSEDIFVIADEPNNQVVVKAPRRLQPQFARLIDRLDLRRPQVYIQAQIVAVTDTKDFRLAIEAQQIIGQWAFNTNFGLSTFGETGSLNDRKDPATNLAGLTTALIRSKDVPFIINALARDTDARIVATPQLLVDDNEEAEVSSLEGQPTQTQTQSGSAGTTLTGFAGFEEAGPRLLVTPQISEGGYLRMEYEIELSSFTGSASNPSLPPPKLTNKISAGSVTVPSDTTIVIGGLTFESKGQTILKVPLIGDIPLVGHLFRDTSDTVQRRTLYVFLTPRIMRDPSYADLRLLTRGPMTLVGIDEAIPEPVPAKMNLIDIHVPPPREFQESTEPVSSRSPGSTPPEPAFVGMDPDDAAPPGASEGGGR